MDGNIKDFGIFFPLVICMKVWGFTTFPIYWLAKQRCKTQYMSSTNEYPAVRLQYSNESVLLIPRQIKNAVTMFTQGKHCDRTLGNLMSWIYKQYPDRPCMGARKVLGVTKGEAFGKPIDIISQSPSYERLTYRQVQEKVENIARGLITNCNVEKGSKVFIFAKTRMEWMISILACWSAGTVATTFHTTSQDEEIELVLGQAMPKLIITEVEWIERLENMLQRIGHKDKLKIITMDSKEEAGMNATDLFMLEKAGSEACDGQQLPKQARDELALVMFTSGTNGHPKGVLFTHEQVVWGVTEISQTMGSNLSKDEFDSGETNLVYLPLAHILQLSGALGCMANGMCSDFGSPFTLVDSSPSVPPGEKGDLLVSMPYGFPMVPLLGQRMKAGIEKAVSQRGKSFRSFFDYCLDYKASWMQKGYNTPILNFLIFNRIRKKMFGANLGAIPSGGSAMPKDVLCFIRTLCFPDCYVAQAYGATEIMAAGTCQLRYCQLDDSIGHTGPNTLVMIKSWEERGYTIHDEEGPCGEMLIGGPQVAQGYLGQDMEDDGESFFTDQNGMRWFRTGDIVRLDPVTNAVSIIDRKKQLLKLLNGKYISLAKIELAMGKLDWIETVCVVTRPDKQQLAAVVVPNWSVLEKFREIVDVEKMKLLGNIEKELAAKMEGELGGVLARYEIPRILHLAQGPWTPDTGLVTPTLKIKRHAIQKEFKSQIEDMMKQIH